MLSSPQEEVCFCCRNLGKCKREKKKKKKKLKTSRNNGDLFWKSSKMKTSPHAESTSRGNGHCNLERGGKMFSATATHSSAACHIRRRCDEPRRGRGNFPYLVILFGEIPHSRRGPNPPSPLFKFSFLNPTSESRKEARVSLSLSQVSLV